LQFTDAVPLVRFRAEAMQAAVPLGTGGMAAILGMDDDAVRAACAEISADGQGGIVEAVNFNAPGQVVIAGDKGAVERCAALVKTRSGKPMMLPVSAPFHSSLLAPAADKLAGRLASVAMTNANIDVVNNVDVAINRAPDAIKEALARQAKSPVRWVETIRRMAGDGVTHVVEIGPGKVLSTSLKRIDANLKGFAVNDAASLAAALEALKG
jgi:[acyl-carrier-protein] S-malonyltransferase